VNKCSYKIFFIAVFWLIFLIVPDFPAQACTLWAAAGERSRDGATLIAKNRDWQPNQRVELRGITPEQGLRFLGLLPFQAGKRRGVAAGINEKGLAIVSASAGSVPHKKRNVGTKGLNKLILTSFDTVDAVLRKRELFSRSRPVFYVIADKSKIALIEVALRGEMSVRVKEHGILFHTNHYIDQKLLWANEKIGKSSQMRLHRIRHLLTTHSSPFTIEDFMAFSEDRNDGPDNSIWRTGSSPKERRTLATWIVSISKGDHPVLYVRLANPDEPERTYNVNLDSSFWTKGFSGDMLQ